jgi:hypothetical protein
MLEEQNEDMVRKVYNTIHYGNTWRKMKQHHSKELEELQRKQTQVFIQLLAQHSAERDELKKILKKKY